MADTETSHEEAQRPAPAARAPQAPAAAPALQLKSQVGQSAELRGAPATGQEAASVASEGVAGAADPLPHLDAIQPAFGRHDVSNVQAQVGGPAADAAAELGADAFITGRKAGFAEAPDLRTAAHEAAHAVQQQDGVQLAGGVGQAGDVYERHADAVAEAVVSGGDAEALLDARPSGGGGTGVQMEDPPDASTRTTATRHPVVKGDTLSKLSRRYLGDPRRWREIRAANPGRVHRHDGRFDMIRVGTMLIIPAATTPAGAEPDDGSTGDTEAMTALDMLRASVAAADGLSAAQTWSTLGADDRAEVMADPVVFGALLACITEAAAVSILTELVPENSRILQLANDRGGSATFLRDVLAAIGVADLNGLGPIALELSGLAAFATAAVLDPLVNAEAVTAMDQVSFAMIPGGRALLEAAWGATFPLDYLHAVAADGPMARESLGSQTAFRDWLLADPVGFSIYMLSQADTLEWARALWTAPCADELAGMIEGDLTQWGQVLAEGMGGFTATDVTAITASDPLLIAIIAGVAQFGGDTAVQELILHLGLSLVDAIKAVDAAGIMTLELCTAMLNDSGVVPADQHAVASDDAAAQIVIDLNAEGQPHMVFSVLATDGVLFTDATVKGQVFAGWIARDPAMLRDVMVAVPEYNGWVKSFVHYNNWQLFLSVAADPALTAPLRTALIAESAYSWLITNADKPLTEDAQATTLLALFGDGSGIALADKYTTWDALYTCRLARPGDDLVFTWTHSTGSLWWKVTYAHRKAYVSIAPNDDAMNMFIHQFRQIPRSHINTANAIYMCQFRVHRVTPDDGSATYFLDGAGARIAAPGNDPMPTSYYNGTRNAIMMQARAGGAPNANRIGNAAGWGWTDTSPFAANTPGVDPMSGGATRALTMFQNHATHEIGHAVGNRTLSAPGFNQTSDEWTKGYADWKQDGSATKYARMHGFTSAMDGTSYTVSHDGGTTTANVRGSVIRSLLTKLAKGDAVASNALVTGLGNVANALSGLMAHAVLSTNSLVTTVNELQRRFAGRMPSNNYFFPFGVPAGQTRVVFYCTRWGNKWVSYDRAAFDSKSSHYAVSSYKEMFAEMYTAKYTGGAVPPAIGSKNPGALFTALDNADPADFGMGGGATAPGASGDGASGERGGAVGAGGGGDGQEQRPPAQPEGDGWDQGPDDSRRWP